MINLIPPGAKKTVKREYIVRVASVWSILLGISVCAVAALLIPVLVMIDKQLDAFGDSYNNAAENNKEFKELSAEITLANDTARLLRSYQDDLTFSTILSEVRSLAGSEVDISSIRMVRGESVISTLVVNGTAATRSSLAMYRDQLEASDFFTAATLPLSNLAQDQEIPFSIEVTVVDVVEEKDI